MKKIIFLSLLICLTFSLIGCATFNTIQYSGDAKFLPTNPNNIKIIPAQFSQTVPKESLILGEIRCSHAPASNIANVYKRLQEEAAKLGADAVVITSSTNYAGTYTTPGTSTTTSSANAYSYSGGVYGYGNSQTTYYPGYSIPVYRREIVAIALKFKEKKDNE